MPLDNKFKAILDYLASPVSNHHAGDKLICYLTFHPNQMIEVKRKLSNWLSLARGYGYSFNVLSMAAVLNKFFLDNPRRKKWMIPGVDEGKEAVSEFFKNDLGSLIIENKVIEKEILEAQIGRASCRERV